MAYTKQTWIDGSSVANAARFNHMEGGIYEGYSSVLDVDGQFGGGWSGVAAACAEAQKSGGPSAVVLLGKYYEANSTIDFTRPFTILGGGTRGTRIRHAAGFTGYVFRGREMKRDGEWEGSSGSQPTTVYAEDDDDGGMTLAGFSIVEDNRNTANVCGIDFWDVDDLLMENIQFGYLTGTALKLGAHDSEVGTVPGMAAGRIRESDFRRIRIYRCGSGAPNSTPDIPAFILQNGAHATSDGTNQNFFHQFRFVYNEGRMLIRGGAGSGNSLRRTVFRDMQLHALADNKVWSPAQWFPFDLVTIQGAVRETIFDGVTVNGNRAGTACWRMAAHESDTTVGAQPKRLTLKNINAVNIHGSLLRVSKGDTFTLEGTQLSSGIGEKVVIVDSGAGFSRGSVYEHGLSSASYSATNRHAGHFDINAGSVNYFFHGDKMFTAAP